MPARAFVIHFPNGDFEYDLSRRALPAIGETLHRRSQSWRMTRITDGLPATVHVEAVGAKEPLMTTPPLF